MQIDIGDSGSFLRKFAILKIRERYILRREVLGACKSSSSIVDNFIDSKDRVISLARNQATIRKMAENGERG